MKQPHNKKRTSQLTIYIILLAIVIAGMTAMRKCDTHNPYSRQTDGASGGDTLDVAIIYGPLSYFMYGDTLGGINYDVLRDIANEWNRPIKFWPVVSLKKSLDMLRSGKYDILASLPTDASMKDNFTFTSPIFLDRQILIQRKLDDGSLKVTSGLDLANDTVHVEADSPAKARLQNLSKEIGSPIHIAEHNDLSAEYIFYKVASGEFKYAVINERMAKQLLGNYPQISIETPVSFTQFQSWVIKKQDTTLLKILNQRIASFKKTPAYQNLMYRYDTPSITE